MVCHVTSHDTYNVLKRPMRVCHPYQLATAYPGIPTWQGPSRGLSPGYPPRKRRARGLIAQQSGASAFKVHCRTICWNGLRQKHSGGGWHLCTPLYDGTDQNGPTRPVEVPNHVTLQNGCTNCSILPRPSQAAPLGKVHLGACPQDTPRANAVHGA